MLPYDCGRHLPQVGNDRRYTSHQNRDSGISNGAPPRWQSMARNLPQRRQKGTEIYSCQF